MTEPNERMTNANNALKNSSPSDMTEIGQAYDDFT
jgi:hypothetical protein